MRLAAFAAVLLVAPGLGFLATEGAFAAQSLWSAKHTGGVDRLWFLLRDPWLERPTGEGVRVAVIDTGIDASHPDLAGSVVAWRDFVNEREEPYDDHGHGTHVAGIIAARGHVQWNPFGAYWLTGARGVAPGADLIVAKAMRADGTGDDALVARAIHWAMDPNGDGDTSDGACIINLSIGINGAPRNVLSGPASAAIQRAIRAGVAVVVSSGNDGIDRVSPPGDVPGAIVVGATDPSGDVAEYSNWGPEVDVVAPGSLVSTVPVAADGRDVVRDGYAGMAGTSMAAPFVAGVLALMVEADPSLAETSLQGDRSMKVARLERILTLTARAIDDPRAGSGLVDAYGSVRLVDQGTSRIDPAFPAALAAILGGLALGAWRRIASRPRRANARAPA